ncbi:MAG: YggS family pyridoxal phosphate-dependent enzyme, partial [Pseudomonadota bacterium]
MGAIAKAMQDVRQRIATAAASARRAPDSVHLLAVSKTFPASAVIEAYRAGQTAFGESYVQEALAKIAEVKAVLGSQASLEWHFIGPIQSNKTRS